ncbi:hypothetical protein ACHQM5_008800 [Ranunculus cassubicifolius]
MLQKGRHEALLVEVEERISSLPDNILHHILSFLRTEEAVHTCVLSRRWRYIWMGIHTLHFNEYYYWNNKTNFLNFVEKFLLLHDGSLINMFKLVTDDCDDIEPRMEALVSTILRRKIQGLDFSIACPILYPGSLYCSESLTVLKLEGTSSTLSLPASVCFSSLKIMHLVLITFTCEERFQQVSFSCPILKELKLTDCSFISFEAMHIFVPLLERLTIEELCQFLCLSSPEIKIYAESLVSLDVDSGLSFDYSFCNLFSLKSASIDIDNVDYASNLIQGIQYVKELILSHYTLECLPSVKDLLALSNLKKLTLAWIYSFSGELLTELLCSVPQIHSLIIENENYNCFEDYDFTLAEIPKSFLSHLKSLEIRQFFGNESELSLVELLLKNVRAVEKMTLVLSTELSKDLKKRNEVMRRLLIVPRASSCVINFS